MELKTHQLDDTLLSWEEIAERSWSGMLLGNGASRSLWEYFKYGSLYEAAKSSDITNPLTAEDQAIFDEFETTNFEKVLSSLATSITVCNVLDLDSALIKERYFNVQRALFQAVHLLHIPWSEEDADKYHKIRNHIRKYKTIFSTNYDLLLYWSIMSKEGEGFKDYLFWGAFDLLDTEIWGNASVVLYLHGGIHLAKRASSGATVKRIASESFNLLQSLDFDINEDLVPLFVTEGKSSDKLDSIYRSDYLSFAYQRFIQHRESLLIFGHGLDEESDDHLVQAINSWGEKRIAVSIFPAPPKEIVNTKADLCRRLPHAELLFYDHTTHPMGVPEMKVTP